MLELLSRKVKITIIRMTASGTLLYYTEAKIKDGGVPIGNRLYRYQLVNDRLVNPKLILYFPTSPGPFHNGGKIRIGPDNNVYIIIGDLFTVEGKELHNTRVENVKNGEEPNGTGDTEDR